MNQNSIDLNRIGAKRAHLRKSLAWRWIVENDPNVARMIAAEAALKYPYRQDENKWWHKS